MDLVHDPEKAYEAIKLKIPQRSGIFFYWLYIIVVLLKIFNNRLISLLEAKNKDTREHACMALSVLTEHADGAETLLKSKNFLENLGSVIEDPSVAVRIKAAVLLQILTKTWMGNI